MIVCFGLQGKSVMNKRYFIFLLSFLFSILSDSLYVVATMSIIYKKTNSVLLSSLSIVVAMVGYSLGCLLINKVISSLLPKSIFTYNRCIRIFLLLILLLSSSYNISIILLLIIVFLIPIFTGMDSVLEYAILPKFGEDYTKLNSLMSLTRNIGEMSSWAIGGILVALLGENITFIISMLLLILSVILIQYIYLPNIKSTKSAQDKKKLDKKSFSIILHNKINKRVFAMDFFDLLTTGLWSSAVLLEIIIIKYNSDRITWGISYALYLLGGIIAGIIIYKWSYYFEKISSSVLIISSIIYIIIISILMSTDSIIMLFILLFILGFPEQGKEVTQVSLLQNNNNEDEMIRVFSTYNIFQTVLFSVSTVLIGYLVDEFSINFAFIFCLLLSSITLLVAFSFKLVR